MPAVQIHFLPDGVTHTVTSLQLAEHFGIKHQHVLRDIRAIINKVPAEWHASNVGHMFFDVEIGNGATRKIPGFTLTRDGFTLLAMGYNSARAIAWKLRYIEAFNALERAVLDKARAEALEAGRAQGENRALSLLDQAKAGARAEGRREGEARARLALAQALKLNATLTPERREKIRQAVRYKALGLSGREIGKLLDCAQDTTRRYLSISRKLELLPAVSGKTQPADREV